MICQALFSMLKNFWVRIRPYFTGSSGVSKVKKLISFLQRLYLQQFTISLKAEASARIVRKVARGGQKFFFREGTNS
jgi:hypothetical protein